MKKLKQILFVIIATLFVVLIPNFSNAAKVSVDKVSKIWVSSTTASSVKIKWKKVNGAKGYQLYKYNYSKNKYELCATTTNTNVKVKNLKSAEKYKFRVRAYKKNSGKKYYGEYSSVTTATAPGQAKNLKVTGQSDKTISLKWDKVKGATSYKIYVYNSSSKNYEYKQTAKKNSITITGMNPAKNYKIKVRAYKKLNGKKYYGDYSKAIEAKTIPSKVTGLKAYDYSLNYISLSWDKISSEATYRVYRYNSSKKTYEYQGETKNNYFKVSNLKAASEYSFKVRAYIKVNNKKYYGSYSNILITGTCPNKVTGLKIKNETTNSIEIKWDGVKEATGYAVYVYRESYQSFVLHKTTTGTSLNITGLRAAKFYKMYVKAYSTTNGEKYYSEQSSIISHKTDSTDKYKAGIDVSQHQEKIDWDKVKDMGVDFAILRLGWIGNKDNHKLDTYFERNYSECRRLNIPVGVYIYCYSNNVENIKKGADWTVKKLNGRSLDLPVFIDMEDNTITKAGKEELSKMCVEYNTIIQNAGYKPGIYANKYWFDTYLEKNLRTKYICWIAHYTSSSSVNYEDTFTIWQYSSVGKVGGIYGNADLDIMYVKEEEIKPEESTNPTTEEPKPEEPKPEEPKPEEPKPEETEPHQPEEPTNPTPEEPKPEELTSQTTQEPKTDEPAT